MKLEQLTKETQRTIKALAKSKGVAVEEVLERFEAIFLRRKVSKHFPLFS